MSLFGSEEPVILPKKEPLDDQSMESHPRVTPPATVPTATMAALTQFPWESVVSEVKDHPTMEKLESTCDISRSFATKIAHLIGEADLNDKSFTSSENSFLSKCITDNDSLTTRCEQKQVLVGVSGATGAGKSSLLNALLDFPGLLPSSDSSASTATICEVAYNFEEDPKKAFRCDVSFRDLDDVRGELDRFFQDLDDRKSLLDEDSDRREGDHGDGQTWEETIMEADGNLRSVRDKVFAVWGKTIHELDGMSTDDLLPEGDPALDRIQLEKESHYSHDLSDFATKIRQFLDSSQSEVEVKRPAGWAQKMSLWPLIKSVKLFVKADILKNGIILVDLPGLSDVVGARAHLAEEYYGKLDVTMVVTPIVRGADEITGVSLMSKNQALNMKMDGKFNDRSFCVVLSKADILDWPRCHLPSKEMHKKLQDRTRQIAADISKVKKRIIGLEKKRRKAKDKGTRTNITDNLKKEKSVLRKLKIDKKSHRRMSAIKIGTESFKYRQNRDKPLVERIGRILKQQHEELKKRSQDPVLDDFKAPQIFSVGTKAYWDIQEGTSPADGFPTLRYTGIPALRQWLKEVTIPNRKRATDTLLREYQSFYNNLQIWSDDPYLVRSVEFSVEEFEKKSLEPMLEKLKSKLKKQLAGFLDDIKKCDPLKGYANAIKKCEDELQQEVKKWAPVTSRNKNLMRRLSPMTYSAIIRRSGGSFTSFAGGVKTQYHWMEDLASLFNTQILDTWTKELHHRIPEQVIKFRRSADATWAIWQDDFVVAVTKNAPDLGSSYLVRQAAKLSVIKEEFKNSVALAVTKFVDAAPTARGKLVEELTKYWEPGFEAAKNVKSGSGVTARREEVLVRFSRTEGRKGFQAPVMAVGRKINNGRRKLQPSFEASLTKLMNSLQLQSLLIVRNITNTADQGATATVKDESESDGEGGKTPKEELMAKLRAVCDEWASAWQDQDFEKLQKMRDDSVPSEWRLGPSVGDSDSDSDVDDESEDEDVLMQNT
ncbi:hypothetical protein QBC39DRAFT_366970 [Podospora conica]|nr:hypothetical protein QBC39DRAFT_366970 [Schizothecium conicum]